MERLIKTLHLTNGELYYSQQANRYTLAHCKPALLNPKKIDAIIYGENGNSQRFKGKNCYVTVNPDTGILIQTNPHSWRGN